MPLPSGPKPLMAALRKAQRALVARQAAAARFTYPSPTELGLLDHTLQYVRGVLEFYTWSAPNPATYLAEPIIEAWRRTGVAVSLDPQMREGRISPLVLVVGILLRRAGVKYRNTDGSERKYRANTVSEHLRGRQDRKR
jgi:hypothetical protein